MKASKILADQLEDDNSNHQYTSSLVILNLYRNSIELFLKGAIYLISDREVQDTHNLQQLMEKYREILPSKEFSFEIPFKMEADDPETIKKFDNTLDQRFRYPTDKKGKSFYGKEFNDSIFPRKLGIDIEKLSNSFEQIENKLRIYKVNHNKL